MNEHPTTPESLEEDEAFIERIVPISIPEIIGIYSKKDDSAILLELGYMKNEQKGHIVIDVRKELSLDMAENLYLDLKKIFEGSKED